MSRHPRFMRLLPIAGLVLALHALTGCGQEKPAVSAKSGAAPAPRQSPALANAAAGKALLAYAPESDFSGAAPEDMTKQGSALFDGAPMRDAVAANGAVGVPAMAAGWRGKRLPYTAAASERITDLHGAEPPLPDDYDYSRSGATPGSARGAGQTLLGFAKFQVEQKFATIAPIMSRLGWGAAPRRGANEAQSPYRVTVHHTDGHRPMNEAEAASAVKGTQHYHMVGRGQEGKDNFADIGYHFLIAGDGRVIEGRRAEYIGAHVQGGNDGNIGVAMMGDYNKLKPTDGQVESLTRLVTYLAIKYKRDPEAKGFLEGHQHYNDTDCPGKNMMAILVSLRHKIDKEKEQIMAGGVVGANDFTPLAVVGAPSA